jgi:hypothetical protein
MTPFAQAASDLQALGFSVLPLIPHDYAQHQGRGKCPGEYRSGHWQGMGKWQRFRDTTPSAFELGLWSKAPGANIGLLMGTVARKDLHVVVLDFDANGALVGIDLQHASQRVDINNLSVSKLPLGQLQAA